MATALDPQAEKLSRIHTIPELVKYLDEELGWPVGVDDWEDAVYDWQPEELNLKPEHQVAINSIKQLKPHSRDIMPRMRAGFPSKLVKSLQPLFPRSSLWNKPDPR